MGLAPVWIRSRISKSGKDSVPRNVAILSSFNYFTSILLNLHPTSHPPTNQKYTTTMPPKPRSHLSSTTHPANPPFPSGTLSSPSSSSKSSSAVNKSSSSSSNSHQSAQDILLGLWDNYTKTTPQRVKLIDVFMGFLVVLGGLQFLYCVLVGNYVSFWGFPWLGCWFSGWMSVDGLGERWIVCWWYTLWFVDRCCRRYFGERREANI